PAGDAEAHYAVSTRILETRRCRGVAVLDEGIAGKLQARLRRPVVTIPDETEEILPALEPERVRRLRAAISGRRVIGLLGELSRRKGVVAFLKAAAASRVRGWVFLLAGSIGESQLKTFFPEERALLEAALKQSPENLLVLGERIEDEREFNAVVRLCDVLFAAYETFGHSSGIVTKAAVFHKPILVSPGYCMAERVTRFKIGLAIDPVDTAAVVAGLATLLDADALARQIGSADFAGCHREHALAALPAALDRVVALAG
ncbi:MAG: glycosyltransferase, partial [Verrucomicrobia bacterium]|nr:glycosyltransferase [Verrucomicrobiota bacterium]